jgi:hypothetical protein
MKIPAICTLLASSTLLLTGCDQTARKYAANLADLLNSMQNKRPRNYSTSSNVIRHSRTASS